MFARKNLLSSISRAVVVATVVAVTAFEPSTARAGSAPAAPAGQGLSTTAASDATDFSSRRRHYRRGGGAAAAAAFAGIVGTGIAIAATQNRRHYYDHGPGYYGGGPVYYGGGQRYYRSQPYYGGRHYGGYPSNHYGRGGAFDTLTPQHNW